MSSTSKDTGVSTGEGPKEHEIVFGLTDYEVNVLRGALIERGEEWEADTETCNSLVAITDDQLGEEDEDGGWDVLRPASSERAPAALTLSPDAAALVAALFSPDVEGEKVFARDEVWAEVRAAFPATLVPEPDPEDFDSIHIGEPCCLFCGAKDGGATHCPECGTYNRETAL